MVSYWVMIPYYLLLAIVLITTIFIMIVLTKMLWDWLVGKEVEAKRALRMKYDKM